MNVNSGAWQWFSLICVGVLCALVARMVEMNQDADPRTYATHDHSQVLTGVLRELDAIRQEMAELRGTVDVGSAQSTLAQRVAELESIAQISQSASEVPTDYIPGAPADQQAMQTMQASALPDREREMKAEAEHFESIDRNLAEQPVDPDWSALASDAISYGLAQPGEFPISVTNVDCRSTACRVELRVDDHVSNDDVLMAIPPETRTTFPRLAMHGSEEDPAIRVVYLGSDGWAP